MPEKKGITFIATVAGCHAVLFVAIALFVSLPFAFIVNVIWMACWMLYCQSRKNEVPVVTASIPAIVLFGGPVSWLLYPLCLFPNRSSDIPGWGTPSIWLAAQKTVVVVRGAFLAIMSTLFSMCSSEGVNSIAAEGSDTGTEK